MALSTTKTATYSRFGRDSDFHCSAVRCLKNESKGKHSKHRGLIAIQQNSLYFISFAEEIIIIIIIIIIKRN